MATSLRLNYSIDQPEQSVGARILQTVFMRDDFYIDLDINVCDGLCSTPHVLPGNGDRFGNRRLIAVDVNGIVKRLAHIQVGLKGQRCHGTAEHRCPSGLDRKIDELGASVIFG